MARIASLGRITPSSLNTHLSCLNHEKKDSAFCGISSKLFSVPEEIYSNRHGGTYIPVLKPSNVLSLNHPSRIFSHISLVLPSNELYNLTWPLSNQQIRSLSSGVRPKLDATCGHHSSRSSKLAFVLENLPTAQRQALCPMRQGVRCHISPSRRMTAQRCFPTLTS